MPLELLDEVVDFLCEDGKPHTVREIAKSARISTKEADEISQILCQCQFADREDGSIKIAAWLTRF